MELRGVCLITNDVRRLVHFYEQVLATTSSGDNVHAVISAHGAGLVIYSQDAAVKDMKFIFPSDTGHGRTTLMFEVPDVDLEYQRLQAFSVKFLTVPTTYPWGARSVHFWDPDGNIVDFYASPPQ